MLIACQNQIKYEKYEESDGTQITEKQKFEEFLTQTVLYIKNVQNNGEIDCEANNISRLYEDKYSELKTIKYAYIEINNDNIDELVTSIIYSSIDYDITDIYALEDGAVKHIVFSDTTHTYYIVNAKENNEKFIQETKELEDGQETIYYKINGSQLVEIERVKEMYTDAKYYYKGEKEMEYVEVPFNDFLKVTSNYSLYSSLIVSYEEIDI
jgi:hypothetical protein